MPKFQQATLSIDDRPFLPTDHSQVTATDCWQLMHTVSPVADTSWLSSRSLLTYNG
ncbi:hypothetical protein KXD97_15020 [Mycobacterium sp. SMC-8]|uniref:hypothetical protein n=1 Tax=Mycobacterium sp. SMC-8 TaxID=2857060 RepID=UPI0021B19489|nr:hypothetical protein [Mycobacterium sp. SMC-8]UXA14943.1 hypothetical protein KXD97_15020 [Mycobacterium sp. SMC-8]